MRLRVELISKIMQSSLRLCAIHFHLQHTSSYNCSASTICCGYICFKPDRAAHHSAHVCVSHCTCAAAVLPQPIAEVSHVSELIRVVFTLKLRAPDQLHVITLWAAQHEHHKIKHIPPPHVDVFAPEMMIKHSQPHQQQSSPTKTCHDQ